ncbi:Ig-like domain-containing protein [Thalassolituus sp.]|uniref:tandem-95 repeat protein n=1 Tax=Thalassolituus sp. TaxID=2030822 RepID=UPI0032D8C4BC
MSYVRFGLVLSMFLVLSACSSDGGSSDSGSTTVDVVITDPDKAAAFLDIFSDPVTQATEDERWEYALVTSAVLAENLSFRLVSGPSGMTISPDGLVQWTPTDEHGDTVNVTIEATYSDENGTVSRSQTFVLPVKHINDAPVIVSEASTSVLAGEIYTYAVQVEDPDDANNGTDLTYVVTTPYVSAIEGLSISNTGVIQWQAPSDPSYILQTVGYYFKVKVSDGGENGAISATQTWYLKVVPGNTAPVITSSPVTVATEDQAYSYQLVVEDAEDQNNGADLTFALSDGPAGMTVSSTGLIQWTPTENGTTVRTQSVQVSVADGGEQDVAPAVQAFDITVTPVNDAPTFIGSPSTSAIEGSTYTYALQVTDPDDANNGTDLTFSLTSAPAGMTISSTGVISWTAPANVTSASVEAIVADGGENGAAAASLSWTISVDAVNDAPTITSVAPTMATEDSPYVYQLVVADPDDDNNGTDLTFTLVTAPEGMTVSATGAIAWTPVGHEGTVDVTIDVADGGENGVQPASQNFTIAVTAVNDAPVITSEAVVTATEDETYSYEVSAADEENDVLQWSLTTAPEGMIIDSATGVITWTPAETVTSEAVVVEVSDGEFNDTQSFTVAVTAVNDAPVITEGEATALVTDEDTATTLTLNATDVDTDSANLIWTIDTDALNGAAIVSGTGASQTVTYTPTANFSGSDSFVVAVSDGELVATITVNVTVTEAGDAPVITEGENVSLTTNEDNLVLTVLSATDLDTDAANLSWSANDATNGQASVSGSGLTQTVTYIPNANFSGNDSFIVTVSDGVLSDMITVSVTVNSVNDAPVITSVPNTSATEAVAYSYAVTASDVEGDTLTWSLTEAPAGMVIDADTGVISWTPTNASSDASVTVQVSDGAESTIQTFTVVLGAVNDAPVITEGDTAVINTNEDTLGSVTLNATDADSATLTWSVSTGASNGSASVSGTGLSKTVNYTPNADFSGTDSLVVAVSDGSLTDTIVISVNVAAVNDAPMFISAPSTNAIEASLYQYTAQVSDADDANNGTDLTFTLTQAPEGMTVSATGVVQWTPGNTVTTADVTLEVIDGGEDGTVAAVQSWTITVGSVNDSPEITSAAIVTATEGMVYQYPVQVTDPDDANNGTDLTFELTTAPAGMTVSSMGLIEWTPTNDDVSVPVTVVVRDGGESGAVPATQSWTIAVTPVNDAPEITQGATTTLSVEEDTLASLGLNATDIDTAATSLTWSVSSVAVNGVASVTGTGSSKSVSYTPNADFNGSDEFAITVSDGELSDTITVNVTVNAVNDAPVMTSAAVTDATEDEAYTYAATASDIDGDTLTWSLTEFPEGMAIDASSGVISWTPANGVETANVTLVVADADASATQTFTITVVAVNDAPEITSSPVTVATEGEIYSYTVTATDAENDTLTWSLTQFPDRMTIDANSGEIIWTPANGATDANVTVEVTDGAATATQDFVVIVGAVNDAPVITEGETATLTTDEDVVGNLVLNATDADTDAANITWSIASAASNGTANVTGTGLSQTVSYSPNADFNGSDSFTVSITDGALTDTITVNVTVNAVNDAPFINSAANTHATEGVLYTYTAMASDVESDTLTWSLTQSPEGMTIDANSGVISWTPANGVTSADITVQVADAEANATQSFTVTVGGVNDAPTITETTAAITTDEDTSGTVTLNATDIDGDTITWALDSAAANGVATVSGTGLSQVVSYAPNADFNGTDSFVVRITDDSLTDTITVNVTVNAANDAPAITETTAAITTDEDTSGTVTLNATDIDGDTINWSVGLAATNGVATVSGAGLSQVVSYAPNANFNGSDSFIVSITDGSLTDTITVDVTVNAANDAPVITSTAITSATEGEVYTYTATATDAENDTLIWSLTTAPSGMNIDSATGVITWTPGNGAISENVVVEVTDSVATTTQSFTITIGAVNDAPVITEGATAALSTDEDTAGSVTLNATDADSAILTWTVSSAASNGSATVTGSGLSKTVSYTPNANFNGTDSFVVTVSDGSASDTITVNVSVAPIADAPVITEGETSAQSTDEDTAKTFALNATDVDGSTITWTIGSAATNGTASVSGNGASNTVNYTPNTNFNGTDSFVVQVSDGALTDTITVTMTVNAVNDMPVITSTAITTATEGQVYSYVPAATDVDGDTLTWSLGASAPATMSVNPTTGELSWTPINGDTSATIQLFASDETLRSEQNFIIAVTAVNDAPVITEGESVSVTMSEDATPQAFSLVLNATDADNAAAELTWTIASVAANGSATVSGTGTSKVVNYTPSADYNGADSFIVNVTDGTDSDTITVNVTVDAANDAPAITETTAAIVTDEDVSGSVTLNATDIDTAAASITWTILTQAANGTASVNAVNTGASMLVTYAPSVNTNGSDSFVVQISDGELTDTITVNVTVNAVDDAPAIAQGSTINLITDENTAGSVALTAVDIDTDAANLSWTVITDATDGVASISGSGTNVSAAYTPTANFIGNDSFVVQLSDGTSNVSITVNVTVNAVNEAPVITNGATATMTTDEDTQATLSLAATDADGDTLTWSIPVGSGASQGGVAVDGTGLVTYVPSLDTNGTDTFSVQVSDGELTDTIAVTVTITAVNDAPVITEGSTSVLNTNEDDDTGSLTFSATDADGDSLAWSVNAAALHGIVTMNGSQFSYAPNIDFNGSDSFIVQVTDGVASATNTVTVNVAAVNDAPMVTSTAVTTAIENQVYAYNVTASDVEGDVISYSLTTSPSGMAIDSTTGEIRWIPSATGTETVVVSVTDGSDADTQTFDISVQAEPAVAGRAVKGVLSNATVEAATYGGLDSNGDHVWNLIGTTTTDAQGYFGFDLGPQSAPVRVRVTTDANSAMVCDTPSGCVLSTFALYGETGAPEVGLTLDTIVSGADFDGPIAVTPLTNMAAVWLQQFPQAIDDNNILLTHRRLSELFGFGDENYMLQRVIDITSPFELSQAVATDMNRVRHAVFAASLQETATVKGLSVNTISDGLGLMFGVLGGQMPLKSGTIDVTALNLSDGTTSLDYTGFDTFIISAKTVANYVNVDSALDSMIAGFDALVTRWSPEATDPSICLDTDPLVDRTECRNVTTLGEATGYDVANFDRAVAPLEVYDYYYAQVAAAEAGINQTNRSLDWLYVTTEDQTNTANLLAAFSELLGYGVSTSVCVPLANTYPYLACDDPVPSADFTGISPKITKTSSTSNHCSLYGSNSCELKVTGTAQGQTFNVTAVIPDIRNLLGGRGGYTPEGGLNMCYNGTITNSTAQLVLTNVCFNLDVSDSPTEALAPFANKPPVGLFGESGYNDTTQVEAELNALLEVINLRVALRSLGGSLKIVSADNSLVFQTNELDAGFVFDRLVLKGTKTGPVFDVYVSSLSRTNPAGETLNSISGQDLFRLEINDTSYMTTAKVEDKIGLPAVTSTSNVTIEGLSPIIDVMKDYALSLIDTNVTFVAPTTERWQEIQDEVAANLVYGGTQTYKMGDTNDTYTMTLEQAGYIDISQKNSTANAMRIFLSGAAGYIYADETLVATAHLGNSQDGLMISLMDGSQRTYTSANPDPLGGLQGFLDFLTILAPPSDTTTTP